MITQYYVLDISGTPCYVQMDHTPASPSGPMKGEGWFQTEGFQCRLTWSGEHPTLLQCADVLFGFQRFQTFWEVGQQHLCQSLRICFQWMALLYPEATHVEVGTLFVDTGQHEASQYYTLDNLGIAMYGTSWWSHAMGGIPVSPLDTAILLKKPDIMTFTYGPYGRDAVRFLQQLEGAYKTLPTSLAFFQTLQNGDMLSNIHPWLVHYIHTNTTTSIMHIPICLEPRLVPEEAIEYTEPFERAEPIRGLCVRSKKSGKN
jgi:hypothetical protein